MLYATNVFYGRQKLEKSGRKKEKPAELSIRHALLSGVLFAEQANKRIILISFVTILTNKIFSGIIINGLID